jgi:hypothetical protein
MSVLIVEIIELLIVIYCYQAEVYTFVTVIWQAY